MFWDPFGPVDIEHTSKDLHSVENILLDDRFPTNENENGHRSWVAPPVKVELYNFSKFYNIIKF